MNDRKIKGLLIEDKPGEAKAVQDMLAKARGARLELTWVDQIEDGLDQIGKGGIDVVVMGFESSNIQCPDMLTALQTQSPDVPIVILSSLKDQTLAIDAVRDNVQGYLIKECMDGRVLAHFVRNAIERQQLAADLQQQVRKMKPDQSGLHGIIAKSADGVIIVDGENTIRFANPAAEKLFGRKKNKLVGHFFSSPIVAGETTEIKIVTRARQMVTAEMCVVEIEWEGQPAFLATLRDVTGRKKAADEMRENEERFRMLSEAAEEGIAIHDKGVIVEANQALARMFGYELSEMIGMYAGGLATPETWKVILEHIVAGYDKPYEGIGVRKDGSNFVCSLVGKSYKCKDRTLRVATFSDITERKRMEEALRVSEEKLRVLFNTIGVGITVIDMTGKLIDVNETMLQMTGFSHKEEVIGRSGFDFIAERDRGMAVKSMMNTIGKKAGVSIELTLLCKDGSEFAGEAGANVLRDSSGNPIGMVCVARDVTERKRMEEAVLEAARQWQATFDADSDAICLLDADQRILRCNRAMAETFGEAQKKLIGRHCWEIVHGTTEPIPECPISRVKSSLHREDMEMQREDRWFNVTADPILDENRTIQGVVHIIRDITEHKRMEEELQRKEHYFRALIENSADGIMVLDRDGTIRYESTGCQRVLGYTVEERAGRSVFDPIHPEDMQTAGSAFGKVAAGLPVHADLRARHKDGTWHTIEATLTNLLNDSAVGGIVVNLRDITERKLAEEALRKSEEKLRLLADNASDVIVLMDMNLKSIYISPSVTRMLGYSVEDALAGSMKGTMTPSSIEKVLKSFQLALSDEKRHPESVTGQHPLELEMIHKDGSIVWTEMVVSFVRESNGAVAGIMGIIRDITERKRAAEVLRESEEKLRVMFSSMADGVVVTDVVGKIIDLNEAQLRMFGYKEKKEVIGASGFDFIAEWDRERASKELGKVFKAGYNIGATCTAVSSSGREFDAEISAALLHDAAGKPSGLITVMRDITKRRLVLEALQNSEYRFRTLVERGVDGILLLDAAGTILYGTPSMTKMLGFEEGSVDGLSFVDFVHPDDVPEAIRLFNKLVSNTGRAEQIELRVRQKSGSWKWVEVLGSNHINDPAVEAVVVNLRDITERKEADEALRASEEKYSTLVENATDGVTIIDDKVIKFANKRMAEMSGYTIEELTGMSTFDLVPPDFAPKLKERFARRAQGAGLSDIFYTQMLCKDGTIKEMESSTKLIQYEDKPATISITRDVTERKKMEETLLRISKAVESSSDAIGMSDAQGHHLYHNRAFSELFEYTPEELEAAGGGPAAFADKDIAREVFDAIMGGGSWSGEVEMVAKSGRKFMVLERADAIKDENGNVIGLIGVHTDITERKQIEQRYRDLIENLSDIVFYIDAKGSITYVSPPVAKVTDYTPDELLNTNFADYVYAEDKPLIAERFKEVLSGVGAEGEFRWNLKAGAVLWLRTTARPMYDGDIVIGATGILSDITERKKSEEKIQRLNRLYSVLSQVNQSIIRARSDDEVLQSVCKVAVEFGMFKLAWISRRDAVTGLVTVAAQAGEAQSFAQHIQAFSEEYYIGGAAVEGEQLVIDFTAQNAPASAWRQAALDDGLEACISIPISRDGLVMGAFNLCSAETGSFDAEDIRLLTEVSMDISYALHRLEVEELHRALVEASGRAGIGIVLLQSVSGREGVIVFANDQAADISGYPMSELFKISIKEFIPPEDIALIAERYRNRQKGIPVPLSYEASIISKKGDRVPVLASAAAFRYRGGMATAMYFRDITMSKHAEEKLRESEEKYRNVVERANDGIIIVQDGIIQFANTQMANLDRSSIDQIVGTPITDHIYPSEIDRVLDFYKRRLAGENLSSTYETILKRRDGTPADAELNAGVITYKGKPADLVMVRDITERKRAEDALRASEEKIRGIFDSIGDSVTVVDMNGKIVELNEAAVKLFGVESKEAAIGMDSLAFIAADDLNGVTRQMGEALSTEKTSQLAQFRYKRLDGTTFYGETGSVVLHGSKGNAVGLIGVIRDVTKRRRLEEALRENEKKFRTLFEDSIDAVVISTVDGKILDFNNAMLALTGYWREELLDINAAKLYASPADRERLMKEIQNTGSVKEYGVKWVRKDGAGIDVVMTLTARRDEDGNIIGYQGVIRDITERKRAEEVYRRLAAIVESSHDAIVGSTLDGTITTWNRGAELLYGYSAEEAIGRSVFMLVTEESAYDQEQFIEKARRGEAVQEVETIHVAKDGRFIVVLLAVSPIVDADGKIVGMSGIAQNITGRKLIEEALRESEERYRLIADNASDVIWTVDVNLRYTYISPSVQRMRGYSVEEAMAQSLESSLPPSSLEMVNRVTSEDTARNERGQAEPDRSFNVELELNCKDGSTVWTENRVGYLRDADGQFIGYLGISRDITERRRLMQELNDAQQEQIRTKDRFISHVSHEFRSPLASIYQFTTILLDGLAGEISPEQREYLEIVLRNVHQLRSMVDDLLEINRAAAGKLIISPRYVVPAEMIKGVVESFSLSSTKAMRLSADIPGDLPPVLADPARVREVLINLLDNAMKFTPENGSIAVQAEIYSQDPNFICIKVSDTGCGIRHDEIQKIFDYLYQVESAIDSGRKGLGLGLYICKDMISRHGGRIWAESEPGYGSTFFFTLPIFSLSRLLEPIMTEENAATGSVAIVTVEIFPVEKRAITKNDESALQEVWNAVSGCILPSKDVLLPLMPSEGQGAVFCVVLWADQRGAEALVRRMEEHMDRCQSLRNSGLNPAIFISIVDIPARKAKKPFKDIIKKVVDKVAEQTRVAIFERGIE